MAPLTVLGPPLDAISRGATPFPAYLLPHGGTGLALCAAGFLGVNDAIHFARNDMTATCVDTDEARLDEMADLYPYDWDFVVKDAWEFAEQAAVEGRRWDVVSVDTYTGRATDRSLQTLDLWCSLADCVVTATLPRKMLNDVFAVDGFSVSVFPRSPLAAWLVLTRA